MTEPDVAISDYLIAIETAAFAALIVRSGDGSQFRWPFVIFFGATSAAALAGGTVHGFFSGSRSPLAIGLWRATLLALGVAAYATWTIGAKLLLSPDTACALQAGAAVVAAGYGVIVLAVSDRFWIAVAHYLPPAIFLLVAFAAAGMNLEGVAGLVLTLAAAVVQMRRIALVWLTHNATYHVIQAVGLFLIYRAARGIT
jgi:hypothetical protein